MSKTSQDDQPNHIERIVQKFSKQEDLAHAVGLKSQQAISAWVKNRRVPAWQIQKVIDYGASLKPPVILKYSDFFDQN